MTKIRVSKLLSFLLCFVMIATTFGQVPMIASAAESDSAQLTIQQGGKDVDNTELTKDDNAELTVAGAGDGDVQWQYYAAEYKMWINIYGETADKCVLTYAKVCNMLDDKDQTVIRCTQKDGDKTIKSNEVIVTVGEAADKAGSAASTYAVRRSAAKAAASNYNAASQADDEEQKTTYSIVINYLFENNEIASDPWTATIAKGTSFSRTVDSPVVQGYLPYIDNDQKDSVELNYGTDQVDDVTINVVYKPTNVDYTVIHYQQNVEDDKYTEVARETKQGLTKSTVPDVAKKYDGFYALLYEKPAIAADGSTVVEVYYDRYYYLMNFDLDGGYGVEPIYARYGTPISDVGTPIKAGYAFKGWSSSKGNTNVVKLPETMQAENKIYYAVWGDAETVNYTVVYWKENANDTGYSYWGQVQKTATAGSVVSSSDDVPSSVTTTTVNGNNLDERNYFTYNSAKSQKNIVVAGDGSTVVNTYYYRNTYSIYFKGISGTCAIEEHAHGTNCNSHLDCTVPEHIHGEDCGKYLSCTLKEHNHIDSCKSRTCGIQEHDAHTDDCLKCTKTEHDAHTSQCCTLEEHTHNLGCYFSGCSKVVHTHGDGKCTCPLEIHVHSEDNGCYKDIVHTHDAGCYTFICGLPVHTHSESCYSYTCAGEEHTHTDSCYRPCTKLEHTHTSSCNRSNTDNVIYVVTAKYEQNIADVWPTAEKFSNVTLNGWSIDGISNMAVSKRVSMTADLCDTSDHLKYAKFNEGGTKQTLYYMFESFDQTSAASGDTRKILNGTYYDSDSDYSQIVNSGSTRWGQKPIEGMVPVNNGVKYESKNTKVFFYYTRNRSDLEFYNVNSVVKTVSDIMFEQPLKDYRDNDGNLISEFIPAYPSQLEPNAFEFDGWYTTPECYSDTKYDFNSATMPNGNLTLYACWKPVKHTVEFYLNKEALDNGDKLSTHPDVKVSHGAKIDPAPNNPVNGSYNFVGWFYMDGNTEKAFDFANMTINRDLQVYGKWSSNVLKQYNIYYRIQGENTDIAAPTTGSALAGVTKTFDAKGGVDLYSEYQEGYFPLVKSHSLTIDIENDANNSYIFEYVQREAVPYKVRYLIRNEDGSTSPAIKNSDGTEYIKTVSDNRKAVVTENFEVVSGYMPDAYQKRLIVDASENATNEIIFYYTKDDTHAYYKITHYTQNTDGETWTEYASSQAVGNIGTEYSATPINISGFTYDETIDGTLKSGRLTENGLELKLYYTRKVYPYQVRYLEQGTGKKLADPENGNAKYGQVLSKAAIDISNYDAVAPLSQTLNIKIEESQTEAKLNIITFYYKEKEVKINYKVVGPEGCGTVSPTFDKLKVLTGTAQEAVAAANENYRFVGWYKDENCTDPVNTTDGIVNENRFKPTKDKDKVWGETTYYAKFDYALTDLKIVKTGIEEIDEDQTVIFNITGKPETHTAGYSMTVRVNNDSKWETVIKELPVGEYVITEDTTWSWRYTPKNVSIVANIVVGKENKVVFENTKDNNKWLDSNSAKDNRFKKDSLSD